MTDTPAHDLPSLYIRSGTVLAMQWDGSRASIDALCAWVNADSLSAEVGDPLLEYNFEGTDDVLLPTIALADGHVELTPFDWILRTEADFDLWPASEFAEQWTPAPSIEAWEPDPSAEFRDVVDEMAAQDAKWGAGRHLPDGTGSPAYAALELIAKEGTDRAAKAGNLTWRHILAEEVYEALAETDPGRLRYELVQAEAVIRQWIRDIDSRATPAVDGADL